VFVGSGYYPLEASQLSYTKAVELLAEMLFTRMLLLVEEQERGEGPEVPQGTHARKSVVGSWLAGHVAHENMIEFTLRF